MIPPDPIDHPAIAAMSLREQADLPPYHPDTPRTEVAVPGGATEKPAGGAAGIWLRRYLAPRTPFAPVRC